MKQKREEMRMYTILIIEDDEAICRELQMLLQKQGYEAICWNMQEDIRELVKTHDPHIILLIKYFVILHSPYGSDWNANIRKLAHFSIYFTLADGIYITLAIL